MSLQELIDRTVGKKGLFRISAWWMHKILSSIVEELDGVILQGNDFSIDFNNDFAI